MESGVEQAWAYRETALDQHCRVRDTLVGFLQWLSRALAFFLDLGAGRVVSSGNVCFRRINEGVITQIGI